MAGILGTIKNINFLGAVDTAKVVVRGVPGLPGDFTDPTPYIILDPTAGDPTSPVQGQVWYDTDEKTLSFKQNGTTLQIGQEQQWNVRNTSGSTITNGSPVMATGAIGGSGRITVAPMDGTDPDNARLILGLATEDIANNSDGKVSTFGKIRDIQTNGGQYGETWADGNIIYISPTTVGYLTNVEPTGSDLNMPVAFVVNSNPTDGTLAVRVTPVNENVWALRGKAIPTNLTALLTVESGQQNHFPQEFTEHYVLNPQAGISSDIYIDVQIDDLSATEAGWVAYSTRSLANVGNYKIFLGYEISNGVFEYIPLMENETVLLWKDPTVFFKAVNGHGLKQRITNASEMELTSGSFQITGAAQTITLDLDNGNSQTIEATTGDAFTIAKGTFRTGDATSIFLSIVPANGVTLGSVSYSGFTKRTNHTFPTLASITTGGTGAAGGYALLEVFEKDGFDYIKEVEVA